MLKNIDAYSGMMDDETLLEDLIAELDEETIRELLES